MKQAEGRKGLGKAGKNLVKIKICGIRTLEEGLWAVAAGADALGFVFHPESRRYVEPSQVQAITAKLPPFVTRVGVFVDKTREEIETQVEACGLTSVQLHGNERPDEWRDSRLPLIKALKCPPARESLKPAHLEELAAWQGIAQAILIDAVSAGRFGGTGTPLPWADPSLQSWIRAIREAGFLLILAGGLTPENVREGLRLTQPYALDVSTGVEREGKKDQTLLQEFCRQALTPA